MAGSDADGAGIYTPGRRRRGMPLAVRLAAAALLSAILALGPSYVLRMLNL